VTPEQLALAIRTALTEAVAAGDLAVDVPDEVRVERPRNREHGDWSTNLSLQIAKDAGMGSRDVAALLASRLVALEGIKAVDVAGPGFLNITVDAASAGELARTIVEPHRPDPPRRNAMGRGRGLTRSHSGVLRCRCDPRVLLQRPRSPD